MKKVIDTEMPKAYIERSYFVLGASLLLTLALGAFDLSLFRDYNPAGFLVAIPTGLLAFHTLWLFLNPFAMVFEDRVEIRPSLFHRQSFFFNDLKKISQGKKGQVFITYHDGEVEKLQLFGIRSSHRTVLAELPAHPRS